MATLCFLAIALLATAVRGASLLSEEARNLANPGPLLKRCPCVPINTCYAQGVSLNEQDFLNTHFECPDYTQNHCCGPYFPTLGSDDFYFDDPAANGQGKLLAGFSNTGEPVMIVMAQNNATTEDPELKTTPRVMTVLPETSSTTTTTEATTTEAEDFSTTTVEVETTTTTTEAVTEEPTTTEEVLTTTTTAKPKQRLPKTHSRRVLPRFEVRKSTRRSSTTTEPSTTTTSSSSASSSTATTETLRRLPTRRTLYRSEFRQRLIGSRFRSTTTTTVATTE